MKLNKKIAVPILSTAMGLSLIGGVGGAVAWYQYNSRVTASFVGSSVADSTVLQIGQKVDVGAQTEHIEWGRNVNFGVDNKLTPVTFGSLVNTSTVTDGLKNQAYGYPEAGATSYENGWTKVAANKGYVQFKVYLRAYDITSTEETGKKLAAKDVFLSDLTINRVIPDQDPRNPLLITKDITDAVRVHIAVKDGDNFMISKTKIEGEELPLFGNMDLDGVNGFDTVHESKYVWDQTGQNSLITYGNGGDYQVTRGIEDIVVARNSETGYMPKSGETNYDKKILTTSANDVTEVTVTVWLEGWALLGDASATQSAAVWNAYQTADFGIQVGMQFDCGRARTSFN